MTSLNLLTEAQFDSAQIGTIFTNTIEPLDNNNIQVNSELVVNDNIDVVGGRYLLNGVIQYDNAEIIQLLDNYGHWFATGPNNVIVNENWTGHGGVAINTTNGYNGASLTVSGTLAVDEIISRNSVMNIACNTGTTSLNIASAASLQNINIGGAFGNTFQTTINIGGLNDIVNINGTMNYINTTNVAVANKQILLNAGSVGSATARNAGILIRDSNIDAQGYFKTSAFGNNFVLKAPENAYVLSTPVLLNDTTTIVSDLPSQYINGYLQVQDFNVTPVLSDTGITIQSPSIFDMASIKFVDPTITPRARLAIAQIGGAINPRTSNGDFVAYTNASNNIFLWNEGNVNNYLKLDTNGNVGINKPASYKLDVSGDINISGNYRQNGNIKVMWDAKDWYGMGIDGASLSFGANLDGGITIGRNQTAPIGGRFVSYHPEPHVDLVANDPTGGRCIVSMTDFFDPANKYAFLSREGDGQLYLQNNQLGATSWFLSGGSLKLGSSNLTEIGAYNNVDILTAIGDVNISPVGRTNITSALYASSLFATNNSSFNSNLSVSGTLNARNINISGSLNINQLNLSGLYVSNNAIFNSNVTISGLLDLRNLRVSSANAISITTNSNLNIKSVNANIVSDSNTSLLAGDSIVMSANNDINLNSTNGDIILTAGTPGKLVKIINSLDVFSQADFGSIVRMDSNLFCSNIDARTTGIPINDLNLGTNPAYTRNTYIGSANNITSIDSRLLQTFAIQSTTFTSDYGSIIENLRVSSNSNFNNNLSVSGTLNARNLNITGSILSNLNVSGLYVSNNTILNSNLSVSGNGQFRSINTTGNISSAATINGNTLNLTSSATIKGDTIIQGNLRIGNLTTPIYDIHVAADNPIICLDNSSSGTPSDLDLLFIRDVATNKFGDINYDTSGNFNVNNNAPAGFLNVNTGLRVVNSATFGANASISSLTVTNNCIVNGNLTVANNATFGSNVSISGLRVTNNCIVSGNLNVANNATFGSNVSISNLRVTNNATFNGNIVVGELNGMRLGNWVVSTGFGFIQNSSLAVALGNYAMLQDSVGRTLINSATNQVIQFRNNNNPLVTINTSGMGLAGNSGQTTELAFSNTTRKKKMTLFESGNTDFTYCGLGYSGGMYLNNVGVLEDFTFANALTSSTGQEIFKILGGSNGFRTASPNMSLNSMNGNANFASLQTSYASNIGGAPFYTNLIGKSMNFSNTGELNLASDGSNRLNSGFGLSSRIDFLTNLNSGGTMASSVSYNSLVKMTLGSGGDLGLGIINPACDFHIHRAATTQDVRIQLTDNSTGSAATDGIVIIKATNGDGYLWNYENNPFLFGTNNTTRMTIEAAGNIRVDNNIYFPNGGSSNLGYYQEQSVTMSFASGGTAVNVVVVCRRIGKMIQITIPAFNVTIGTTNQNSINSSGGLALSTWARPSAAASAIVVGRFNAGPIVSRLDISTGGVITLYRDVVGTQWTANTTNCGLETQNTISYNI